MAGNKSRTNGAGREQNLVENPPNPNEFVRFHDRFDYFVEVSENYELSVGKIRKIARYNRSMEEFIVVKMRLESVKHPVYLFIRPRDLYLIGFGFEDGTTYEFGKTGTDCADRLIDMESNLLGYKEGYGDMGGLHNVRIGYIPLVQAVRELLNGHGKTAEDYLGSWKKKIGLCLGTLSVMLLEGTRFNPLFEKCKRLMMSFDSNMLVETWMQSLINGWEAISKIALNGKMSGKDDRSPPTTEDHVFVDDDAEMAFRFKDWAIHVIAVNHQPDALPNVPTVGYQNFHLVIVGDREIGKTTFVKTCRTREFLNNEKATKGVEYHLLDFSTSRGRLRINCWEVEAKEKYRALRDCCYKQCEFALIMFDVTKKSTYQSVLKWHDDLRRINEDIQIVICGNKCDEKKREVKSHQATFPWLNKPKYFETSAKSNLNLEEPFLYLAKKYTRDDYLYFLEPPPDGLENG